jgi:hypothetical protein
MAGHLPIMLEDLGWILITAKEKKKGGGGGGKRYFLCKLLYYSLGFTSVFLISGR